MNQKQYKITKIGKIPKEWEVVKIKDICELGRRGVISQKEIDENRGIYPVYSSQSKNQRIFGYLNTVSKGLFLRKMCWS